MHLLQLKEIAQAHDQLHLKSPNLILQKEDRNLACSKCYPPSTPSESFQEFWNWYQSQYQAQSYTGSTQHLYNTLIDNIRKFFPYSSTDYKEQSRSVASTAVALSQSCRYNNPSKTPLLDIVSTLVPHLIDELAKGPNFKSLYSTPSFSVNKVASSEEDNLSQLFSSDQSKQRESLIDIQSDSSDDTQTQLKITLPQATSTPATFKSESSSSYFGLEGLGSRIKSSAAALRNPFNRGKPVYSEEQLEDTEYPPPLPGTYPQPELNPWDKPNSDYTYIYPALGGYPPKSQQEKEEEQQERRFQKKTPASVAAFNTTTIG
jgi:hypothetical protein